MLHAFSSLAKKKILYEILTIHFQLEGLIKCFIQKSPEDLHGVYITIYNLDFLPTLWFVYVHKTILMHSYSPSLSSEAFF